MLSMKDIYNQYAPPKTGVADIVLDNENFQQVKPFSAVGRMGRMRLITYVSLSLLISFFIMVFTENIHNIIYNPEILDKYKNIYSFFVFTIVFVSLCTLILMWCIQRCHDMNWSGWWFIVMLVIFPLLSLLIIKPGTMENNRFGPPPEPNSLGINALGTLGILLTIFILVFYLVGFILLFSNTFFYKI
jgi:uncharacterized membrane protein YhaH (DUF805 family)